MLTNPEANVTAATIEAELTALDAAYELNREALTDRYRERRKKLRALLAVLKAEAE
jgi:hypothetical protein